MLAAGRALLPARGCAGLKIREVADAAGVNLGMFHYHFRTREAFLRAVLQATYEEMFSRLTLEMAHPGGAAASLRSALRLLGRFLRDNRSFVARVLADALAGDAVAREFLQQNMPRHLAVLHALVAKGSEAGEFSAIAPPQALGVCIGALALPILFAGALADFGSLSKARALSLCETLLSDAAIDERIDLALHAIATPKPLGTTRRAARISGGAR